MIVTFYKTADSHVPGADGKNIVMTTLESGTVTSPANHHQQPLDYRYRYTSATLCYSCFIVMVCVLFTTCLIILNQPLTKVYTI
jgi:hypothetical protein